MAKRIRDFKRIAMTAKTAQFLNENLVQKSFHAHRNCDGDLDLPCRHMISKSIYVAKELALNLKIGEKRATLDVRCPYSESVKDSAKHVELLRVMAKRIRAWVEDDNVNVKTQLRVACRRIADEVEVYANRNAMQVIAESAQC